MMRAKRNGHQLVWTRTLLLASTFLFVSDANADLGEMVPADDPADEIGVIDYEVVEKVLEEEEKVENIIIRKENPEDPCDRGLDSYNYEKSWYDETQIYVNSKFCEPALWFDNFFANDRVFKEGAAGTYIRWRNEFTLDEEESFSYKMSLNASVELPFFEKNLRLTFEGDQNESLRDVAPGGTAGSTNNSLGLQLDVLKNTRSKFSVNVTLTPRILFRYRYTYPVYDKITLRLTQELQNENGVNSARTLVDFEKSFRQKLLFRSSTAGEVSEDFDGIDWLQAFVLYRRLSKKSSFSYESSVSGITQPHTLATNYRLGVRYRRNFHRKWLFYEISPEMTWPVTLDETRTIVEKDRRSKWLLFFRLEVHFGNAYKKRYEDYN